jgi:hypothetical protein
MIVPAMANRAARLFQLLDFCVGGAVLRYRRVGAMLRGNAERAISLGAARNMMLEKREEKRDKEK